MAWTYKILTGVMTAPDGTTWSGYSGFGSAANDPSRVKEKGIGALPPGTYKIGKAYSHKNLGPLCMNLDPTAETNTFGRSAFRIHGDNSTPAPFDGSHGCIILSREARRLIAASSDRTLEVFP